MGDPDLSRYQSALMALFWRTDIDDNDRMRILREDPAFAPYATYVSTFERPFVALGAGIMQSYGRPDDTEPKR